MATKGKRMLSLYLFFYMLKNEGFSLYRSYENPLNFYILSWKNPNFACIFSLFYSIQHRAQLLIMSFPGRVSRSMEEGNAWDKDDRNEVDAINSDI